MSDITTLMMAAAGGAAEETDANFNQTVLLLHGDGTNGAQNNTFLDSSTNNFTITRSGNTTQGTFSPFSAPDGRWSNYFDGTGDYLSIADNTALDVEASNFTIEFFVYLPATPSGVDVVFAKRASGTYQGCTVFFNGSLAPTMQWTVNGSSWEATTSSVSCVLNQFNHIAFTRNSNTWTIWVNGVSGGSATVSGTVPNNSAIFTIGADTEGSSNLFVGHISNFRLVKGTAVYTSAFTPPTTPLTNITNTSLLTCQSNRFVDNSTNNFAITRNGDVKVTPFSPFAPTAAYSASVNGGSGYFDGTGDYLAVADDADFDFGTGDFTVSGWLYKTTAANALGMMVIDGRAADNTAGWVVYEKGDGTLEFWQSSAILTSSSALIPNQWNYFHISRSGSSAAMYINGSSAASATNTTSLVSHGLNIGAKQPSASTIVPWQGYLAEISVVKGTATSNAVPTAPTTSIANTSLLLNFTNAGIFDNTGKNNLETVGNAQIDTTTKKYGTGSMEFDGVSDELKIPSSNLLDFEGDFTIEFWVYFDTLEDNMRLFNRELYTSSPNIELVTKANGQLIARLNDTDANPTTVSSTGVLTTGSWMHIAFVRYGSSTDNVNVYVDGSAEITFTETGACNPSADFLIANYPGLDRTPDCFIDDLRITKGVARYTTTFTPPTKAFPDL